MLVAPPLSTGSLEQPPSHLKILAARGSIFAILLAFEVYKKVASSSREAGLIAMTMLLFWFDRKNGVLDIQEAQYGREKGDKFTTGDDLPEEQDNGDD